MGRLAGSYMERGALVPDDITIKMVMEWVNAGQEESGFLLDGFPRTLAQAEALEEALAPTGGIDKTLHITVPMEELVRRLSGRAICRSCQTPYHSESAPPKEPGRCDRCGGDLYTRDDDQLDEYIEIPTEAVQDAIVAVDDLLWTTPDSADWSDEQWDRWSETRRELKRACRALHREEED